MKKALFRGLLAVVTFVGISMPAQEVRIAATEARITWPFLLTNDCILQPVETGITNGGRAVFPFVLTNSGEYAILVRVQAPEGRTNVFLINIDSEPQEPDMVWTVSASTNFTDQLVSAAGQVPPRPRFFQLSTGEHQLIIRGMGAETRLVQLSLVRRPEPPRGLRIVQ
jgi:hypothetical protein